MNWNKLLCKKVDGSRVVARGCADELLAISLEEVGEIASSLDGRDSDWSSAR